MARTLAASMQHRMACGEQADQKVQRLGSGFGFEGESPTLTGICCASVHGFSLHVKTPIPTHRRDQLERLIRSTECGAAWLERLEADAHGDLISPFTRAWADGTGNITLSPWAGLEKLAALGLRRVGTRSETGGVEPRTARGVAPSRRRANGVWTAMKRRREHRIGTRRGC